MSKKAPRDRSYFKTWTRERICSECGKLDHVRKDNPATRCRSCNARRSGAIGVRTIQANAARCTCDNCRITFQRSPAVAAQNTRQFCSLHCRRVFYRIQRQCKYCTKTFSVPRSVLSGKTNASGNFCSRQCYEQWLCNTSRTTQRGSRWKTIRASVLQSSPWCARCGTTKLRRLQVHHIEPYRLTFNNDPDNLIPLCTSCHKTVETAQNELLNAGFGMDEFSVLMRLRLRWIQSATANGLRKLLNEKKAACTPNP